MNPRDLLPGSGCSLALPSETQAEARHMAQAAAAVWPDAVAVCTGAAPVAPVRRDAAAIS